MEIKEYLSYDEKEILALYESVVWTAYTENPAALRLGFAHSLLTLAAYEGEFPSMSDQALAEKYPGLAQSMAQVLHGTDERVSDLT